jgi:hypothetical protein
MTAMKYFCLLQIGFKGFGITENKMNTQAKFMFNSVQYTIKHGSVMFLGTINMFCLPYLYDGCR